MAPILEPPFPLAHLGFGVCIFLLGMTLFHRGRGKPPVLDGRIAPGGLGLGRCERCTVAGSLLVRTGTARAIQQIETIEKSSSVKILSGKDLWRQIQESSVQSELLSAPSPKAIFTATVQPWVLTDSLLGFCPAHPGEGR